MKNFLAGLAIGLPAGMLLADIVTPKPRSHMAEHMRAIWTDARARAEQLRSPGGISRREARQVTRMVDEQAAQSRERASAASEAGMEYAAGEAALNRVSREELLAVYGIGPVLADRILLGRPYISDYDVVERNILNETTFAQLRRQLLDRYRKSA